MNMEQIYKALSEPLDKDAVEKAPKSINRKGYDTTGYQYQYVVERLNQVLGIDKWTFSYRIIKEIAGNWSTGKSFWDITVDIKIEISIDKKDAETEFIQFPVGFRVNYYESAAALANPASHLVQNRLCFPETDCPTAISGIDTVYLGYRHGAVFFV